MRSGPTFIRLGLAAALVYFVALLLGWPLVAFLSKPLPALCMLGALLPLRTRDAALIAAGLLLSATGDLLLAASLFLPGLGAFLLAHLLYVAAFVGRTRALHLGRLAAVFVFSASVYAILSPHLGAMRGPVLAYVVVISAMLWRAAAQIGEGVGEDRDPLAPWLATIGAALFALSDVMVAWSRFVDPAAGLQLPLMVLYWSGQAAIAASSRRA